MVFTEPSFLTFHLLNLYRRILVGHTSPVLQPVAINEDKIRFSWNPSRTIGVSTPVYDLMVEGIQGGRAKAQLTKTGLKKTSFEVSRGDFGALEGYRWRVTARNDEGTASSSWRYFTLPK